MSSSPRRAVLAVLAAAMLSAPAAAPAQTSTIPRDGAGVTDAPPVPLDDRGTGGGDAGDDGRASGASAAPQAGAALPDTGSDPRMLFLAGVALALVGTGLRLRTADADDY